MAAGTLPASSASSAALSRANFPGSRWMRTAIAVTARRARAERVGSGGARETAAPLETAPALGAAPPLGDTDAPRATESLTGATRTGSTVSGAVRVQRERARYGEREFQARERESEIWRAGVSGERAREG